MSTDILYLGGSKMLLCCNRYCKNEIPFIANFQFGAHNKGGLFCASCEKHSKKLEKNTNIEWDSYYPCQMKDCTEYHQVTCGASKNLIKMGFFFCKTCNKERFD